jgi:hypothetical protein
MASRGIQMTDSYFSSRGWKQSEEDPSRWICPDCDKRVSKHNSGRRRHMDNCKGKQEREQEELVWSLCCRPALLLEQYGIRGLNFTP